LRNRLLARDVYPERAKRNHVEPRDSVANVCSAEARETG
jgi:hypothetical protein